MKISRGGPVVRFAHPAGEGRGDDAMSDRRSSIEAPLILGPEDDGRPVSAEVFAAADFVPRWRYERKDGRLVVMAPIGKDHDDCSEPLRDYLGAYRLARPDVVQYVVSEAWIRVDDGGDRIGDIGVYL